MAAAPVSAPLLAPDAIDAVGTLGPNRWYGWELLLLDAAAATLAIKGGEYPPAVFAGLSGLVIGAPLLHVANGEPGRAMISIVVRGLVTSTAAGLLSHGEARSCPQSQLSCDVLNGGGDFAGALIAVGIIIGGALFAVVEDLALTVTHDPHRQ